MPPSPLLARRLAAQVVAVTTLYPFETARFRRRLKARYFGLLLLLLLLPLVSEELEPDELLPELLLLGDSAPPVAELAPERPKNE